MPSPQDIDAHCSDPFSSQGFLDVSDDSSESSCSFPPFSPITCSSATSYPDGFGGVHSSATPSPAPSIYSLTDSIIERCFNREHGRTVSGISEVYRLPADDEEIVRLKNQHETFSLMMGPWVPPLPEVLAPEPGITKSVLDLGCGTGSWITNIAREFPECSAVGVDLMPIQPTDIPQNCRIEIDDINSPEGLGHHHDNFDVVRASFILAGITDFRGLIDHMTRCLRPRGLIAICDIDCGLYNPDKTLAPPWSSSTSIDDASYLSRWYYALVEAVRRRGADVDAAPYFHLWIRQHHSFAEEDVVHQEYWCPIGHNEEWGDIGFYSREVAERMRIDFIKVLPSGRPLLLGNGMHPEEVDFLQENAQRELEEIKKPMLLKFHSVYARKRATQ